MKKLLIDNTVKNIFVQSQSKHLDVVKLSKFFNPDETIYFQQKTKHNSPLYHKRKKALKEQKIQLVNPIKDEQITSNSYASICELSCLNCYAVEFAEESREHYEDLELIFCINHLSYAPMLTFLKERYPWINITVACVKDKTHNKILSVADYVVDLVEVAKKHNLTKEITL